jgi:hypothetical protein
MIRDLGHWVVAVVKHTALVLAGTGLGVVLILWPHVAHLFGPNAPTDIPDGPFWAVAVGCIVWAVFLTWREERLKVIALTAQLAAATVKAARDPELELRAPQFEKELAKLSPEQEAVLRYVAGVGDSDAPQLRDNFFREQGQAVSLHDADMLLTTIAETTLLEAKTKGQAYTRYAIKPAWSKLLIDWAAPPTPTDKRIADKATDLRRMLLASFEGLPPTLPKLDDLTNWAGKLQRGANTSEAKLREMVELRPEASRRVEREVGTARDAFNDGTGILNRLYQSGGLSIPYDERGPIEEKHREALAHVRRCLDALDKITRT